jgi:hypothetical protein
LKYRAEMRVIASDKNRKFFGSAIRMDFTIRESTVLLYTHVRPLEARLANALDALHEAATIRMGKSVMQLHINHELMVDWWIPTWVGL